MSSSAYENIDLDQAYSSRHRQCPDCNKQTIQRTADCLSKADNAEPDVIDITIPGVYCTNCGWFELNKHEEKNTNTITTTITNSTTDRSNTTKDKINISLDDSTKVEVDKEQVEKISPNRILAKHTNGCPECDDTVLIEATTNAKTEDQTYAAVREVCINYSESGRGCQYRSS
jgi:hypothetical protein